MYIIMQINALVLAASPLVVTQSLHSRIARALPSQRKIKEGIIGEGWFIETGGLFQIRYFEEIHINLQKFTVTPITKTEQEIG